MIEVLETAASKFGLHVNEKKTEYLLLSRDEVAVRKRLQPLVTENRKFKRVREFKYLGTVFNEGGSCEAEINARIQAGNRCYHSLGQLLKARNLSRQVKIRLYKTLIQPVVMYGCETWSIRRQDYCKLLVFERKVLRKIFGPVQDATTGEWRIRHNEELNSIYRHPTIVGLVRSKRLEWAGHVSRMRENRWPVNLLNFVSQGKRPRGRPRKRWSDGLREDLNQLGIDMTNWQHKAADRHGWRRLVVAARGPLGLIA